MGKRKHNISPQLRDIGNELRRRRVNGNLSQEAVAEILEVHVTTYGRIESGNAELSILKAMDLARMYHISLDQLLGFDHEVQELIPQAMEPQANYKTKEPPTNIILQLGSDFTNSPAATKFLESLGNALIEIHKEHPPGVSFGDRDRDSTETE